MSEHQSRRKVHLELFGSLELTPDALVERFEGITIVYGRWDRFFGCWHDADGRWTSFTPCWPLLDYFGEPLVSEQHEIGKTLAAYARLVPIEIRWLVGPYASRQWVALGMLRDAR